jgi:hypothetical protein
VPQRYPSSAPVNGLTDVDTILSRHKTDFAKAGMSLENARQRMIKATRGFPNACEYQVGDFVKTSTRTLELQAHNSQVAKLQPKFIGPFEVIELVNSSVRVSLPDSFGSLVHDVINVDDIRP